MNHLWFGKSLKEAIAAPVVFVDSQNAVKFEANFDEVTISVHLVDKATCDAVFSHPEASSPVLPAECHQDPESFGTQSTNSKPFLQRGPGCGEGGRLYPCSVRCQETGPTGWLLKSEGQ